MIKNYVSEFLEYIIMIVFTKKSHITFISYIGIIADLQVWSMLYFILRKDKISRIM